MRRAIIEQLNEDYVLYLRASGVHTLTLLSHVLRNALQVAVSIFCMSVPMIMGGLVVIENVFAWPGLGQLSIKAIVEHDFPVIQAYVLIVAVLFIIFNIGRHYQCILKSQIKGGNMMILKDYCKIKVQ